MEIYTFSISNHKYKKLCVYMYVCVYVCVLFCLMVLEIKLRDSGKTFLIGNTLEFYL